MVRAEPGIAGFTINSGHELCNHPVSQSWDYSDRGHFLLTPRYVGSGVGGRGRYRQLPIVIDVLHLPCVICPAVFAGLLRVFDGPELVLCTIVGALANFFMDTLWPNALGLELDLHRFDDLVNRKEKTRMARR